MTKKTKATKKNTKAKKLGFFKSLYAEENQTPLPFDFRSLARIPRPKSDLLREWIQFYLSKDVIGIESPHTAEAKAYDLHKFLVFSRSTQNHESIALWDKALTSTFVTALENEYEISTVYRIFASLTNFASFLVKYEMIKAIDKPTEGVPLSNEELPLPQGIRVISKDGVELDIDSKTIYEVLTSAAESFVSSVPSVGKNSNRTRPCRDSAIFALLYHTGLRVDEVCNLLMEQLEMTERGGMWLRGVKCKGKRIRNAYVNPEAAGLLMRYIERERGGKPGLVFQTYFGEKLHRFSVWKMVKRIAKKAEQFFPQGTRIDIHPHSLRHERAFTLLQSGLGEAMVAEQLGHQGLNQVARYSRKSEKAQENALMDIRPGSSKPKE